MMEIKPIFSAICRSKVGAVLLLIQIAITTAIVSNAAFIIHEKLTFLNQPTGLPEQDIISFSVLTYDKSRNLNQQFDEDEYLLRNIPGVVDATIINAIPLSGGGSATGFSMKPSDTLRGANKNVRSGFFFGDEHIINTLGIAISEGRNFTANEVVVTDDNNKVAPVAIASRTFLNEMFGEGEGLGKVIFAGDRPVKIVGVVEKMKNSWLNDSRPDNTLILPYVNTGSYQNMMVRTEPGQRAAVMKRIEDTLLNAFDKRVIVNLRGLDVTKAHYNAGDTLMMRMLLVLIVVLVAVTALGIFGLTLFNISKRTRQIGTRRALGARKSDIIRYFIVENLMICLGGLIIGSSCAILLGQQLLEAFSLPSLQAEYVLGTALSIMLLTILAVIFPARRAASISPSVATRSI